MLTVSQLSKSFAGRAVFDNVSLQVNRGDRIGLVGPNGAGKSTLFALLLGDVSPDKGTIAIEKNATRSDPTLPPYSQLRHLSRAGRYRVLCAQDEAGRKLKAAQIEGGGEGLARFFRAGKRVGLCAVTFCRESWQSRKAFCWIKKWQHAQTDTYFYVRASGVRGADLRVSGGRRDSSARGDEGTRSAWERTPVSLRSQVLRVSNLGQKSSAGWGEPSDKGRAPAAVERRPQCPHASRSHEKPYVSKEAQLRGKRGDISSRAQE
jgi:energy-coupling factor transporter ATP-binding protein EcfA2